MPPNIARDNHDMRSQSRRPLCGGVILLTELCFAFSWGQPSVTAVGPSSKTAARIAVFEGIAPTTGTVEPPPEVIRSELSRRGLPADILTANRFLAGDGLSADRRYDLLIIPRCDVFPAKAVAPLLQYLKSGGRMLLIGGRPLSKLVVRHNDSWLTEEDIQKWRDNIPTEKLVVSFSDKETTLWRRASGSPANPTRISIEPSGHEGVGGALRADVAKFENWDTVSRAIEQPFPDDPRALTCFWARGSKDTPELSMEWVEKDGSRWIAVVGLSTQWRHYALPPERFAYWRDNPSKGRGGYGDCFNPRQARRLAVGLSRSHTPGVENGNHTYWLADIGWSHDRVSARIEATPPNLEILSPWYKTSSINRAKYLRAVVQDVWPSSELSPGPIQVVSPIARTTGVGLAASRTYRWIPWVMVFDDSNEERGTVASILVCCSGKYADSAWGFIGIPDMAYLRERRTDILRWIEAMSQFLLRGVFLTQGGAEQCCYFEDEPWSLQAEIANRSDVTTEPTIAMSVFGADKAAGPPPLVFSVPGFSVKVPPRQSRSVGPFSLAKPPPHGLYHVATFIFSKEFGITDVIQQTVRVLPRDRKPDPKRLVRVRSGNFELDGKPWVPFGINFWPLSVTGSEDMEWRLPGNYDPERVQRDLERVRAHGMNVVCIQLHSEEQARPTMDFLERCRALDLRAFVFLPGGNPLNSDLELLGKLIRAAHLAETDAVFAYDVAWEPLVGEEAQRKRLDERWREWIVERYGGIENAEKDWRIAAPRDEKGRVTGPSNKQVLNDGPHRVMVAAYRRFLDDAISQGYGQVVRAIRNVDPNHLIGVRSGYGGTGSPWADAKMPFDLASGAKHLDFISPEGYGHGPSWETVRNAGLTTLYGRMVSGGKPVWWAEYGMSVYPDSNDPKLAKQGELYANFARMFVESRANGGAGWWFPGGYRINEDSDFGIFNPDGSARPAALANREWSERVAAIRAPEAKADVVIKVDRDLHPRGYSQIRARHEKEYLAAVEAGKSVALATDATDSNSDDVPLVAVGNRPCNGNNPPKYLNAEFEQFWLKMGDSQWHEIQNGERVKAGQIGNLRHVRILGRAKVANTGQAAWLTPKDPRASKGGAVYLVSTRRSELTLRVPLTTETPPLGDCLFDEFEIVRDLEKDCMMELEIEAAGRARFGQHFRLHFVVH